MKHRTNVRRVIIKSNKFRENSGFYEVTGIHIRARGPYEGGSVYSRVPVDPANAPVNPPNPGPSADSEPQTTYYCSGYHIESNYFKWNIGCTRYAGSLIKFECVDYGE
jgi:hypothetical protein